jgi:hypothetical protein
LPALTVTYTGFVNGDTPASLTMPPILTTTATVSESARQRSDYGERCHGPELHDYFHRRHADYYARTLDPNVRFIEHNHGYRTLDPLKRHGLPRLRGLTRHNHVIGRWTH